MFHPAAAGDEKYDVIMLDVDSKDPTVGMSSPPKVFVQPDFLKKLETCLTESGKAFELQVSFVLVLSNILESVTGLEVKGGNSLSRGREFEPQYRTLGRWKMFAFICCGNCTA